MEILFISLEAGIVIGRLIACAYMYDIMAGTGERRAKYRDEQFPKDLQSAYELGKRLVLKAENAGSNNV